MKSSKRYQRIVVKVGSSVLTGGRVDSNESIIGVNLERIVKHIASLSRQGKEVVLVSSGAIACGLSSMGTRRRPTKLSNLQAAAAIGQGVLMHAYRQAFRKYALECAQILITRDDFHDRKRHVNIKSTISMLLNIGVIPIVNENDTVSVDEIKFGDNDLLSALVAVFIKADGLTILSDIEGLCRTYDKDKKSYRDLIKRIKKINPEIKTIANNTNNDACIGGMKSKIEAIKIAADEGIPVVLANGRSDSLKIDFENPEQGDGTYFEAASNVRTSRKKWIDHGAQSKGTIVIDDGARKALVNKNASLLSQGVVDAVGEFSAKDVVDITDTNYAIVARGITAYSCLQLQKTKGRKADKEVVHRDNLVLKNLRRK